ncbi:uracil-DNA glycosylase [uncultured Methanolobus sp.]|uniref:uracil-DNA glycosylase n=1 Tax=uncultured Methanolobus sp. TaxID=218300 RepID=UPI002AABE964|nr:uracil-DNA glycosylase [uncultured Methanolobus sp.]
MKNTSIFKKKICECTKCINLVKSRSLAVPGYGYPDADILFIGLAPGRYGADKTGKPFTKDASGKIFQTALSLSDMSMEPNGLDQREELLKAYVTNLVKCNPRDEKGNNRYPTSDEVENCLEYLHDELDLINAPVVVPLGKLSTEHVTGRKCKKLSSLHNVPIRMEKFWCVPFLHPSYVARGAYSRETYFDDFRSLSKFVRDNK